MSSLRNSYDRITSIYPNQTAFGEYTDGFATVGSPFVVAQGVQSIAPNNKVSVVENNVNGTFYNGAFILPDKLNDAYIFKFSCEAFNSSGNGSMIVSIDVSPLRAGTELIVNMPITFLGGASVTAAYDVTAPFYASANFMTNKGTVFVKSQVGTSTIHTIKYSIYKIHSGSLL